MIFLFNTIIRTAVLYFLVITAIRVMGKRQIGDMQPGELVITILISEIAAIPIQDLNQPILTGVVAVFTLCFLEILVSVLTMKSPLLRRSFYGSAAVIINNGVVDEKRLKQLRVTVQDLLEVLRNQGVFCFSDVKYAILETNGQLSVMLKKEKQPAAVENLDGTRNESLFPCLIVNDGKINKEGLKFTKRTKDQIEQYLLKKKLEISDVLVMTCDDNGNYSVIEKEKKN